MSLKHVGETGYAVFAAMSVSSQLAGVEIEQCVELVRSLVGEVDLAWNVDVDEGGMKVVYEVYNMTNGLNIAILPNLPSPEAENITSHSPPFLPCQH